MYKKKRERKGSKKQREREERTFGCSEKVMGLNGDHMFPMRPMGNYDGWFSKPSLN